jgi:hypothetical protein
MTASADVQIDLTQKVLFNDFAKSFDPSHDDQETAEKLDQT